MSENSEKSVGQRMRLNSAVPPPCGIDEIMVEDFTVASRHRGFCKREPDLHVRSTEPERVPTRPQSRWFRWSTPPGNWRLHLDSASQKVAPRLELRAPVAAGTLGIPGPCGTQPVRQRPHEKLAGSSVDKSAVLPVAAPH